MNESDFFINKADKTAIKKKINEINNFYNTFFSKTRFRHLLAFKVMENVATYIIVFFLLLLSTAGLSALIDYFFKNQDSSALMTISYSLFAAALTIVIGAFIAIGISLSSSNEYFNKPESKLFFEITITRFISNGMLGVESIAYIVVGFIGSLLKLYTDSILQYLVSTLFSAILLIRFAIYCRKNKYDRLNYCLLHSPYNHSLTKSDLMKDYIIIHDFIEKSGKVNKNTLTNQITKRIKHMSVYSLELSTKIQKDENIAVEQNVLEDYYVEFSKTIETPIQVFALSIEIEMYLKYISKSKKHQIKDIYKTRDNLLLVLKNIFNTKSIAFIEKTITLDSITPFSFLLSEFCDVAIKQYNKITDAQFFCAFVFSEFVSVYNKYSRFLKLRTNDLSCFFKKVEELEKKCKKHLEICVSFTKRGIETITEFFTDTIKQLEATKEE